MSPKRLLTRFALALLTLLPLAVSAEAADRNAEILAAQKVIAEGSMPARWQLCRDLEFSGLSDVALFDAIESKLLQTLANPPAADSPAPPGAEVDAAAAEMESDYEAEEEAGQDVLNVTRYFLSYCGKALATSGNPKYLQTLVSAKSLVQQFPHRRGRNLVVKSWHRAARNLAFFENWNAIINSDKNHRPGQDWAVTRTLNMLKSGDTRLASFGGARGALALQQSHPELLDLLEADLLAAADDNMNGQGPRLETLAWYAKALGNSGNRKYLPTLKKLAEGAATAKLRRYAGLALEKMDPASVDHGVRLDRGS